MNFNDSNNNISKSIPNMTKVEKYLLYRKIRDTIPKNDIRSHNFRMQAKYEELSHMIAQLEPTAKEWEEHTFKLMKKC